MPGLGNEVNQNRQKPHISHRRVRENYREQANYRFDSVLAVEKCCLKKIVDCRHYDHHELGWFGQTLWARRYWLTSKAR